MSFRSFFSNFDCNSGAVVGHGAGVSPLLYHGLINRSVHRVHRGGEGGTSVVNTAGVESLERQVSRVDV